MSRAAGASTGVDTEASDAANPRLSHCVQHLENGRAKKRRRAPYSRLARRALCGMPDELTEARPTTLRQAHHERRAW